MNDNDDLGLSYMTAMHGVQSGIAHEMGKGSNLAEPKHLRVGIDSAMVNDAAVARLLIDKGIFTVAEYEEAVRREANREVQRYEGRNFR